QLLDESRDSVSVVPLLAYSKHIAGHLAFAGIEAKCHALVCFCIFKRRGDKLNLDLRFRTSIRSRPTGLTAGLLLTVFTLCGFILSSLTLVRLAGSGFLSGGSVEKQSRS